MFLLPYSLQKVIAGTELSTVDFIIFGNAGDSCFINWLYQTDKPLTVLYLDIH